MNARSLALTIVFTTILAVEGTSTYEFGRPINKRVSALRRTRASDNRRQLIAKLKIDTSDSSGADALGADKLFRALKMEATSNSYSYSYTYTGSNTHKTVPGDVEPNMNLNSTGKTESPIEHTAKYTEGSSGATSSEVAGVAHAAMLEAQSGDAGSAAAIIGFAVGAAVAFVVAAAAVVIYNFRRNRGNHDIERASTSFCATEWVS